MTVFDGLVELVGAELVRLGKDNNAALEYARDIAGNLRKLAEDCLVFGYTHTVMSNLDFIDGESEVTSTGRTMYDLLVKEGYFSPAAAAQRADAKDISAHLDAQKGPVL